MAFNYKFGAVDWLSADPLNTTYAVTGLGFTPKALRFSWPGPVGSGLITRGMGVATSASDRGCVGTYEQGNVATTACASIYRTDAIAATTNNAGTVSALLDVASFDADGFTLIVDDALPSGFDFTVYWEAWGGSDITVAVTGEISEPAVTGNVTPAVTGFQTGVRNDQIVMLASITQTGAAPAAGRSDSGFGLGYLGPDAGGSIQAICVLGTSDDASSASDTDGFCQTGKCIAQIVAGGGNVNGFASAVAWASDGFTVSYTRAVTGRKSIWLALKGGTWAIGQVTIAGNTLNATATVSGLPFAPGGLGVIGRGSVAQGTTVSAPTDQVAWGMATGTTARQGAVTISRNATPSFSELTSGLRSDAILPTFTQAAGTSSYAEIFDLDAFTSDGFRLIVDQAGGVASEWIGYLAFAVDDAVSAVDAPSWPIFRTRWRTPL